VTAETTLLAIDHDVDARRLAHSRAPSRCTSRSHLGCVRDRTVVSDRDPAVTRSHDDTRVLDEPSSRLIALAMRSMQQRRCKTARIFMSSGDTGQPLLAHTLVAGEMSMVSRSRAL
jgi:hypothetical protein